MLIYRSNDKRSACCVNWADMHRICLKSALSKTPFSWQGIKGRKALTLFSYKLRQTYKWCHKCDKLWHYTKLASSGFVLMPCCWSDVSLTYCVYWYLPVIHGRIHALLGESSAFIVVRIKRGPMVIGLRGVLLDRHFPTKHTFFLEYSHSETVECS